MTLPQSTLDAFTTLEQFRDYFAGIPEERWCVGKFVIDSKCCARGHLGSRSGIIITKADDNFAGLIMSLLHAHPSWINNWPDVSFPQPTPRARILAAIDEAIAKRDLK